VLTAGCLLLAASSGLAAPDLRGVDHLARVYEYILDARFDQADAELDRACPPAPAEACAVLSATATWWKILLDPGSHALDKQLTNEIDEAIRATEAWVDRDERSAEAYFYLGAAYAVRVQLRVLRDQKVAAARDGKRIRQALERALALDPTLDDAHFGIGLYKYYADVAPTAAKVLRFFLLLPGGDRDEGLAEMLRARRRGHLLQGEADYQLHVIYLWYEKRTDEAAALLESLHDRYPGNPLFLAELANIRDTYQHDLPQSLQLWRELLAAAREQRVNEAALAQAQARLAIARELDELCQTDRAIDQLRAMVDERPARPYGALASAYLTLGEAYDRLGDREAAVSTYRLALAAVPARDPHDVRSQASDRIRHAPDAGHARAYRLSLDGFRKLEQSDNAGALADLAQSVALDPSAGVARYRYGRALLASRNDRAALAQFAEAVARAKAMPPPIAAAAYLEAARVNERLGHRDDAIAQYRAAETWFGGGTEVHASAARALTRLGVQR
jgi:tetratricopeptide (TPR) repeat protein